MDRVTEYMLVECGDFGRSQYVMLMAFGVINILASINYYSQTIITFVPAHWSAHIILQLFNTFLFCVVQKVNETKCISLL